MLLLTGPAGVDRATVLREAAEILDGWRLTGFTTERIESDDRRGYRSVSVGDGPNVLIARTDDPSEPRVDGCAVDVAAIDEIASATLRVDPEEVDAVLVDEIGRMTCLSSQFLDSMTDLLDAPVPVVATVAEEGNGLIAEVKNRPEAMVGEVTAGNRERLPAEVAAWLQDHRRAVEVGSRRKQRERNR
jgi:nucleoside-triphosphatase